MNRRRLSDDERTLWRGVTRSVKPLDKFARAETNDAAAEIDPPPVKSRARPQTKSHAGAAPKPLPKPSHASAAPVQKPAPPSPLESLGRRAKKRVARGSRALDGRLDLHGLTQAQAHDALLGFLRSKQERGCKLVLVITGKGAGGDAHGGRGVLKRMVPMWLGMTEFRSCIVGFESAAISHGGEGALYVSLRKQR
jgi:DNA-nicking Smr family endonuclease